MNSICQKFEVSSVTNHHASIRLVAQGATKDAAELCTSVGAEAAQMPDVSHFHRSFDAEEEEEEVVVAEPLAISASAGEVVKVRAT